MDLLKRIIANSVTEDGDRAKKVDAYFFNSPENLEYILGSELESGLVIVFSDGTVEAIVSPLDVDFVKEQPNLKIRTTSSSVTVEDVVYSILDRRKKTKHIGFEMDAMTYGEYRKIFGGKPKLKYLPLDFTDLRRTKTDEEIQILGRNAKKADAIFEKLKGYLKINAGKVSELDVAKFIHIEAMNLKGKVSFSPIIASGINGKFPHARPTKKIIRENELITLDFGIKVDGLSTDMTRTVSIGKPKGNQDKVFDMVHEAQRKALLTVKAGKLFLTAHMKAIEVFKSYGVRNKYVHGIGHGLGINVHEAPYPKKNIRLLVNDVITIEPGLYDLSGTGCRIEDTVVVTKDGFENLCKSKKDLVI